VPGRNCFQDAMVGPCFCEVYQSLHRRLGGVVGLREEGHVEG
jgi:hypothetical protein